MPACGRDFATRFFCAAALAVTMLVGTGAAGVKADALDAAFPASDWRKAKTTSTLAADCVSKRCGPPAHVAYSRGPANAAVVGNIRSGSVNREWAEKLAATFRRSQSDEVKVVSFTVQTDATPGWAMVYECNCEGTMNYISSRIVAGEKNMMTFYSVARTAESAEENMNKMVAAVLGPTYTGSTSTR
jgi:hypothetical protein